MEPTIERIRLTTEERLILDWSNYRHQAVRIKEPYKAPQVMMALEELLYILKEEVKNKRI